MVRHLNCILLGLALLGTLTLNASTAGAQPNCDFCEGQTWEGPYTYIGPLYCNECGVTCIVQTTYYVSSDCDLHSIFVTNIRPRTDLPGVTCSCDVDDIVRCAITRTIIWAVLNNFDAPDGIGFVYRVTTSECSRYDGFESIGWRRCDDEARCCWQDYMITKGNGQATGWPVNPPWPVTDCPVPCRNFCGHFPPVIRSDGVRPTDPPEDDRALDASEADPLLTNGTR